MPYKIAIKKNDTGEVRLHADESDWFEHDAEDGNRWLWTEGNFGCDCNRHLWWLRAGGPGPEDDPHWNNAEHECGQNAYVALFAELPDGTRIPLDDYE